MDVPEGWTYDSPDRNVGIWDSQWLHEKCGGGDFGNHVTERVIRSRYENKGINRILEITTRLSCSCGERVDVIERENDPEEWDE